MSLIQCPECGKNISDRSKQCVHCGYPIAEWIQQQKEQGMCATQSESEEQQEQDTPGILYGVKDIHISNAKDTVLSHLNEIYQINSNFLGTYENNILASGLPKSKADLLISYIEKNGGTADLFVDEEDGWTINQDLVDYIEKMFREFEVQRIIASAMNRQMNSAIEYIPRCPICGSTNLSKISTITKAAKIGAFGILGAGDVGKTYKCDNCGAKF